MSAGTTRNVPKCPGCKSPRLTLLGDILTRPWQTLVECRDCRTQFWSGHPQLLQRVAQGGAR